MQNNAPFALYDSAGQITELAGGQSVAADGAAPLKVIYIAGDGRSGSTLLDRLIGAYPGVFSCGELGNLLASVNSGEELCACNAPAAQCPFWRRVLQEWSAAVPQFSQHEYRALQERYERLRSLFRPRMSLSMGNRRFARYAEYTLALFRSIARLSGCAVVVDSSKSPARALALSRVLGLELHMLHLVRDVRGVAYSLRIPYRETPTEGPYANVKRRSHLRFAGTWALVNYCCERVRTTLDAPSLFLRYEDYTTNPGVALATVAQLLDVPSLSYATGAARLLKQGHQIAGNVIRMQPVQNISPDETWRSYFGFMKQKGLYLLVLPLMLRYRYRL